MFISPLVDNITTNIFQPISMECCVEERIVPKAEPHFKRISCFVSEPPSHENCSSFKYLNRFFKNETKAFNENQIDLINVSSKLFQNSRRLTNFEERILTETILKSAKKIPTRPNRK